MRSGPALTGSPRRPRRLAPLDVRVLMLAPGTLGDVAPAAALGARWRSPAMKPSSSLTRLVPGSLSAWRIGRSFKSMPSGHALIAAVTAVAVALILTQPGRSRRLAIAAAAAWSILVALSRTYLSAHWLTDVLDCPVTAT